MSRLELLDDPQLRPFLPLLYVAWSDGELSHEQHHAITRHLERQPWLRPAARIALESWLQPDDPPTPSELGTLREVLRAASGTMAPEKRRTLVELGQELATSSEPSERGHSRDAARELATILGIDRLEPASEGLSEAEVVPFEHADVDVEGLRAVLDGAQHALRDRVRAFLAAPEHRAYGLEVGHYRTLIRKWLGELAATGIPNLAFPGVTADAPDLSSFMVAFETLALGDLSLLVKTGVQFGLFGGSIYFLGSARHRALLADVASLKLLGCFAMSESGHGSNVADLETVARYDHDARELVITTPRESARKDWIGGAGHDARMATVFAQLEVGGVRHGVHAVLVPIRDDAGAALPGVRTGDCGLKMGLNGVDNGRLWFDGVRVPVGNLLDRFGTIDADGHYQSPIASASRRFFSMLGTLVGGRVCVGSAGVSVAKSALAIAVRYSVARRQFGPAGGREVALLTYPTHQRRLLPALATTYVLCFAFERLRQRFVAVQSQPDPDTRELEAEVAGLKAMATWHATKTVQQCREACGGQGYLAVNRLPDLKADSDVFATFEGDNTVLVQLVAKQVLSGFGKSVGRGVGAFVKLFGDAVATAVTEKNPIIVRDTARDHLRDRDFHLQALAHRAKSLVQSAAQRMRKRMAAKMDAHDALLEIQEHLIAAAIAHVDHLALQWFDAAIAKIADPWLAKLGQLHALARIEETMAWYLEDGYVEPVKARAIRKEVEALCRELAPAARGLVDAFGIPDALLAAPIAFGDPSAL